MDNQNPFEKFIVDENVPLDKELVVEIVTPYIESIGKNKIIKYTDKFEKSPAWVKMAIYLCIRKIMVDQKITEEEETGPKEIAEDTHINAESAKDISRNKNLQKIVSKKGTKYYIKNYDLKKLKGILKENETNIAR